MPDVVTGNICKEGRVGSLRMDCHPMDTNNLSQLQEERFTSSVMGSPQNNKRSNFARCVGRVCFGSDGFQCGFWLWCTNALWVKLCWKVVIGDFTKMISSGPIFLNLNYFRQNIWRLSSVQFLFWYIYLGTSWIQSTAEEGFTIGPVSIQAGCRKDVNKI